MVPNPQMPLITNPNISRVGCTSTGRPFSGATISVPARVGRMPPKRKASPSRVPVAKRRRHSTMTMPQMPPQKAKETTLGRWKGGVVDMS